MFEMANLALRHVLDANPEFVAEHIQPWPVPTAPTLSELYLEIGPGDMLLRILSGLGGNIDNIDAAPLAANAAARARAEALRSELRDDFAEGDLRGSYPLQLLKLHCTDEVRSFFL